MLVTGPPAASLQVSDFDGSVQSALLLREGDWVETEAMTSLAVSLGQPAAASATEHLAAQHAQHAQPPTTQEVNLLLPIVATCRAGCSKQALGMGQCERAICLWLQQLGTCCGLRAKNLQQVVVVRCRLVHG